MAVALTAVGLTGSAAAGTRSGQFALEGTGAATCAQFLSAKTAGSAEYRRMVGFLEGYLTAANHYEPNTFDLSPWQDGPAFALMIGKNCQASPKERLAVMAQRLAVALKPQRLAEFSERVTVPAESRDLKVYGAVLQRAQAALRKRGLFQGADDGRFSPAMKTALVEFQKTAKLDPTGLPDMPTLWMLLNP